MKSTLIFFTLLIVACVWVSCDAQFPPQEMECPENEIYYACGNPCQTKCSTLGKRCNIVNVRCPKACYCIEGYARDANRKCIPIEQC